MRAMTATIASLLLLGCGASAARAQMNLPDADEVAGSTAALVGFAASGVLSITNLNYSPEGHAVAGGLGVAVGVGTAIAGVWWLGEAETTRGDVIGGFIVASGAFAVLTGARSVYQASKRAPAETRQRDETARSVRVSPLISRDRNGDTEAGVALVMSF